MAGLFHSLVLIAQQRFCAGSDYVMVLFLENTS
jgi:hypothetical protein